MAKRYEVKVYNPDDEYLTTWSDRVSNIKYNNEINSAGGQMSMTLARNAGDYGEGTDVDFNHKVKVYVLDQEQPYGQLIFQGYISAYTPIYKDNNVEITVLSFGAELNDYIIEAGESLEISQLTDDSGWWFGNGFATSEYRDVAQVITAPSQSGTWGSVVFQMDTYYANDVVGVRAIIYQDTTPDNTYTTLGVSDYIEVTDSGYTDYTFTFTEPVDFSSGTVYVIQLELEEYIGGSANYLLDIITQTGNPYAGGAFYYSYN